MNYKIIIKVIIFGGAGLAHLMASTPVDEPMAETESIIQGYPNRSAGAPVKMFILGGEPPHPASAGLPLLGKEGS